ncbi:MAG: Hsp20/alpha crystallin family protein [Bdellovibrionales bacterium]|nr:Hsp20/alpha crystallin family protein [Bdellovibrionales bacterium]
MRNLVPYWASGNLSSDIFREMDRMFNDLAAPGTRFYDEREFAPATEVVESDNHYLLSVDLPGMKKEDIQIEMVGNTLTISGERKQRGGWSENNQRIQRSENLYSALRKSFVLPNSVSTDKIEANYADGVLELYLPKTQLAQSRKIEIQSGKDGFLSQLLGSRKSEKAESTAAAER